MNNPDNKKLTLSHITLNYQDKAKVEPEQGIKFTLFSSFNDKL